MDFEKELAIKANTIVCGLKTDFEQDLLKLISSVRPNYKNNPIGGWEEWSYDKDYSWNIYSQSRNEVSSFNKLCEANNWCEVGFSPIPFLYSVPMNWNLVGLVEHPLSWIRKAIENKFHISAGDGVSFRVATVHDYAKLWVLLTKKIIERCKIFRIEDVLDRQEGFPNYDVWNIVGFCAEKLGYTKQGYLEYIRPKSDVSVVITCHNYGHFLSESIESILSQTKPATEIIVIDDSSTDNTKEITEHYNVNYVRCDHRSAFLSRKVGFEKTTCKYIIFLDADDAVSNTYIQECIDILNNYPKVGICTTNMRFFGDKNQIFNPEMVDIGQSNWIHSSAMVRRSALIDSKVFELELLDNEICEDWFVWKKVVNLGYKVYKINKPLIYYRRHNVSRSLEHLSTGMYYTWAGLAFEPITVFVNLTSLEQWEELKNWLEQYRHQISELIILDQTKDLAFRQTINSFSTIFDSYIYLQGPLLEQKCLLRSSHEFIFVIDEFLPKDNIDFMLKKMDYNVMKVVGDGCRLIRRSSLIENNFIGNVKERNKTLEVVMITPVLTVGGAEQWIRMLVTMSDPKYLRWRIVLVNSQFWHPLTVGPIQEVAELYTAGDGLPQAKSFGTVEEAIVAASENADVIVAWGGDIPWPMPVKLPTVVVSHGTCHQTKKFMDLAFTGGATHFAAVSELAKHKTCKPEMNAKVIWNCVDPRRLRINKNPEDILVNSWKVPKNWFFPENLYVGYVGRLSVDKNVLTIVKAVSELPYQFKCCFVGDGNAVNEIITKSREILDDRFYYLPSVDDVGNYFNALDVMVATSNNEGNSLTLIEAMYCGCPIVTTRTGAVVEFERRAGCELFISLPEYPTVNETAAAIRRAVAEGRQTPRIQAAKKFAEEHLTDLSMVNEWTDYLFDICHDENWSCKNS